MRHRGCFLALEGYPERLRDTVRCLSFFTSKSSTNAARISKRRLIDLAKEAFIFGRMSVIALHHRKLDLGYHNGTHQPLRCSIAGGNRRGEGLGLCSSASWAEGRSPHITHFYALQGPSCS